MINKIVASTAAAVAGIHDGATVMIGGFGTAGMPSELIDALILAGARDLTIVNNNAGNGDIGLAALLKTRRVRKIICSFPRQTDSHVFDALFRAGEIELELVPQGNLAERIRAAGAGIGAFFTPTGYGTLLAEGKETRVIDGLIAQGAKDLVIVNNNAGNGDYGLAALLKTGRVRKIVCSFPRQTDSHVFDALYRSGKIELELVPQGNLAERIRAAGAGIGGFFTPTGYGTELAKGKETREIDGRMYVLESPIHADFALIKAERGDRWGNLTYRMTARNFGPVMAMAARTTVASVHEIVELGALDPEAVVTPGLFVQRVVRVERAVTQGGGFKEA